MMRKSILELKEEMRAVAPGERRASPPNPSGNSSSSLTLEVGLFACYLRFLARSSNRSLALAKRARRVLSISSASAIAARVSAFGTLRSNGSCLSAATRVRKTRT